MAPVIELSETTFRRLQERAVPFQDTPETVILKLLDAAPQFRRDQVGIAHNAVLSDGRRLPAENPGSLTHTKVLSAHFGSRAATKWNELIGVAHEEALKHFGAFEALRGQTISAVANGDRGDSGYHYLPRLGFSIQYVDSNNAWRHVLHLAKRLGVTVEVQFLWREKDGAAYPGQRGLLLWSPAVS